MNDDLVKRQAKDLLNGLLTEKNIQSDYISVKLDIAMENQTIDQLLDETKTWAQKFGVNHVEVVKEEGPGGGHPLIKFTGAPENVKNLVRNYVGQGYTNASAEEIDKEVKELYGI